MYRDTLGQKRRNGRVAGIQTAVDNHQTFWHGGNYGLPPQPAKSVPPGKVPAVAPPKPAEQIVYGIAEAFQLGLWSVNDATAVKTHVTTTETAYVTYVTQSGEERWQLARKTADEQKQLSIAVATLTKDYLNAAAGRVVTALTTFVTTHPSDWANESLSAAQANAAKLATTTAATLTDATNQANAAHSQALDRADDRKQKSIDRATTEKDAAIRHANQVIFEAIGEAAKDTALALLGLYDIVDLPWEPRPGADLPEAPFTLPDDIIDYAPRFVDTWFASVGTPEAVMVLSLAGTGAGSGGLPYSLIGSGAMFVRSTDDGGSGGIGPNGTNRTAARTSAGRRSGDSLSQGFFNVTDESYAQQSGDSAELRLRAAAQQEVTGEHGAQFPDTLAPSQKKPGGSEPPIDEPPDAGISDSLSLSGPADLAGVIDGREPPWMDSFPDGWIAAGTSFDVLSRLSDLSHLPCLPGMSPYTTIMWYAGEFTPECGRPFDNDPLGVQFNVGISDPLAAKLAVELLVQMAEVVEKLAIAVADSERLARLVENPDGPWVMEDANRFRYENLLAAKRGEIDTLQDELDRLMQEFVDLDGGETLIAISNYNPWTKSGAYRPTSSIETLIERILAVKRQHDPRDHGIESFPLAEYIAGSVAGFVRLALAKATARAFAAEAAETVADAAIDLVDPSGVGSLARGVASGLPGRHGIGRHPRAGSASEAIPAGSLGRGRVRIPDSPDVPRAPLGSRQPFDWSVPNEVGKGISAEIDDKGIVTFYIEAEGSLVRGQEMFRRMMEHFGEHVRGIRGYWANRSASAANKNLGLVNRLTAAGMELEDAIRHAWTAQRAAEYGFRKFRVIDVQGTPGNFTRIEVLFFE